MYAQFIFVYLSSKVILTLKLKGFQDYEGKKVICVQSLFWTLVVYVYCVTKSRDTCHFILFGMLLFCIQYFASNYAN